MSQNQLEQRIEIYTEALKKISKEIGVTISAVVPDDRDEYSENLRQLLWDYSNETRQSPSARIARKALKEASLVWISTK